MGVLIDTSVLVAIERGVLALEALPKEDAGISVITVSELLHGVHRATGANRLRRRAMVDAVLARFLAFDVSSLVARVHAEIWSELERTGTRIGGHDLWIGATAITHGLGVVTLDARDFMRIPGLRVVSV
jgi:predicted nucleic acid-binding protein